MSAQPSHPPYFDRLVESLQQDDPQVQLAFGRHVHWGYWRRPAEAACSATDYRAAAERLCLEVLQTAEVQDGQSIVDVGCGFGGTLACINERFSDVELTGVNIDARQLLRAAQSVGAQRGNAVRWVEADAAQLPLPNGAFDVLLAVECAFHFDRQRFLSEASRVLRRGGNLTISDFVPDERAAEFLGSIDLSSDAAIGKTYGVIDLNWPVSRYQQQAAQQQLKLAASYDVTAHTLPTYEFLQQCVAEWEDSQAAEEFCKATRLLERASRRGLIQYRILRFDKS